MLLALQDFMKSLIVSIISWSIKWELDPSIIIFELGGIFRNVFRSVDLVRKETSFVNFKR